MVGAKRRTKRVASNRAISAGQCISKFIGAWDASQELVLLTLWPCLTRHRGQRWSCSRMLPTNIGGVLFYVGAAFG